MKKITAFIVENKNTLGRKALVIAGCIVGGLLIDGTFKKSEAHIETVVIEDVVVEEKPEESGE